VATNIKALLRKRGWTGDDVGKAIILSLIDSYKQTLQGVTAPKELFTAAQLRTMILSLKDKEQGTRYNRYIGLNNWISQNNAVARAYYEQARGEVNRLLTILSTAHATEDEYQYIEKLPAIMTQKQYDDIRAQRIEEQFKDENGETLTHGVFNLLNLSIGHFVSLLQKEPRKANPLKPIKKKYQCEPVTSPRILCRHNNEDPPEGLTKWDIIELGTLFKYYPALAGEHCETYAEQAEDFKAEFPELFDAVVDEIDKRYFNKEAGIGRLSLSEWPGAVFTFRELYNKDFFGFRRFIEANTSVFDSDKRAIFNGIAILRPSDLLNHSSCIDARGYYMEPERVNNISLVCGLEQFTPLNTEYLDNIEQLEVTRKTVIDSYYFLMGYDKAVELIAEHIGIPDFTIFKTGKEAISERIDALNHLASLLYKQVKESNYRDQNAKAVKLQVLKDHFQALKWTEFAIPEESIAQAKSLLNHNMKAFEIQDGVFLGLLTSRKEAQ